MPSLVTWPIRKTVIPVVFANSLSFAADSRTCEIEPAADSISGNVTVWIESTITKEGVTDAIWSNITPRLVSVTNNRLSGRRSSAARRTARILIWRSDSSPDTYKTVLFSASCIAICKVSVLLPMPGSPPINTIEPGTIPPPNTLANSSISSGTRSSLWPSISASRLTWDVPLTPRIFDGVLDGLSCTTSSTILSQLSQLGQRPNERELVFPQTWQT